MLRIDDHYHYQYHCQYHRNSVINYPLNHHLLQHAVAREQYKYETGDFLQSFEKRGGAVKTLVLKSTGIYTRLDVT